MSAKQITSNQIVINKLAEYLRVIEKVTKADCLSYVGPISDDVDNDIRDAIEAISNRRERLVFVLETPGGFAETTRRISDLIRYHYNIVDFIVPGSAMSAGTILVMSGDSIHMDYHSRLGPIDPQITGPKGNLVPALGYVLRYEALLKKANNSNISEAELQILLNFDQGELYWYEQARDLSLSLLKEWLVKYKFKDWNVSETKKIAVTPQMKRARAQDVARKLNDVKRWRSHGFGINMERLRTELKLKIDDYGTNVALNNVIRPYHRLLMDYMGRMRIASALQTRTAFTPLLSYR